MHLNTKLLFCKYFANYFKDGIKVLEIGPDSFPSSLKKIVNNPTIEWHTLNLEVGEHTTEVDNLQLNIIATEEYSYPIENNAYDIIVSANVMEHVKKVWSWYAELKRITKEEGYIITLAPISWPYHESPVDCWRIFPEGMNALYEEVGLKNHLSVFENLEKDHLKISKSTPVINSHTTVNDKKIKLINLYNRIQPVKALRIPLPVSVDLFSAAQKTLS